MKRPKRIQRLFGVVLLLVAFSVLVLSIARAKASRARLKPVKPVIHVEPCECQDPDQAFKGSIKLKCGPSAASDGPQRALLAHVGLQTAAEYITQQQELDLIDELEALKFKPYVGKDCLEIGMNFSFYISNSSSETFTPILASLARRIFADGLMSEQPNYVLVNRYAPGQGIHPHEDDAFYTDSVASLTLGSGASMRFFFNRYSPFFRSAENARLPLDREKAFAAGDVYACAAGWFAPRSLFSMRGEARWGWKHEMKPRLNDAIRLVEVNGTQSEETHRVLVPRRLRYAVTFRRVRDEVIRARWAGKHVSAQYY